MFPPEFLVDIVVHILGLLVTRTRGAEHDSFNKQVMRYDMTNLFNK